MPEAFTYLVRGFALHLTAPRPAVAFMKAAGPGVGSLLGLESDSWMEVPLYGEGDSRWHSYAPSILSCLQMAPPSPGHLEMVRGGRVGAERADPAWATCAGSV